MEAMQVMRHEPGSRLKTAGAAVLALALFSSVLLSFFMPPPCAAQQQPNVDYGDDFVYILYQLEEIYLKPNGMPPARVATTRPDIIAVLVGHALMQQVTYVTYDPELRDRFNLLQGDAMMYLEEVTRIAGYRDHRGNPLGEGDLWQKYTYDAVKGKYNGYVLDKYGVSSTGLNSVFNPRPQAYKLRPQTSIELLRVIFAGPEEPERPDFDQPPSSAPPPNSIVGSWSAIREGRVVGQLQVRSAGNNRFKGVLVQGTTNHWNWKLDPNEECFDVGYSGTEGKYCIYRGKAVLITYEGINPRKYRKEIDCTFNVSRGNDGSLVLSFVHKGPGPTWVKR
jgi:hypothetical protein